MKKIVCFLLLAIVIHSYGQIVEFPINENGEVEFSEVVETNLSSSQMYSNAKEWVARSYADYKSVVQFDDQENFKLIIKGINDVYVYHDLSDIKMNDQLEYTITIECKEKKYRYRFNDIRIIRTVSSDYYNVGSVNSRTLFEEKGEIDKMAARIKEKEEIDQSNLLEREKKKLNKLIEGMKTGYPLRVMTYNNKYRVIQEILQSLKKVMPVNNDF